jgi:Trypsin
VKEFVLYIGAQNVSADFEDGRLVVTTSVSRLHPKYKNDIFANDIALIKLPKKVEMSKILQFFINKELVYFIILYVAGFINFIRLPRRSELEKDYIGARTVVSGWGLTKDSNKINNSLTISLKLIFASDECDPILYNLISLAHKCLFIGG